MRVLIADDHAVVRHALRMLLQSEPDIEVIGEAANGREAVELTHRLGPDIVLMDISMPEMDGIEATRMIHGEAPSVCVIGLSMFEHDRKGEMMRDAGASDYVVKSSPTADLLVVMRGCFGHLRDQLSME